MSQIQRLFGHTAYQILAIMAETSDQWSQPVTLTTIAQALDQISDFRFPLDQHIALVVAQAEIVAIERDLAAQRKAG